MSTIVRLIAAIAALSDSISSHVSAGPFDGGPISGLDIAARAVPPSPETSSPNSLPGKPNAFAGSLLTGSVINGQTTLTAGATVPTGVYNPNGPVFNPNDYASSLPFTWPGKPSAVAQTPPPRPTTAPFQPGGSNASLYHSPAWITNGIQGLTPSLGQSVTNGNSTWGILPCPSLPSWLGGNPPNLLCTDQPPNTGITRYYDLTIGYQKIAPDGVIRNGITFNGQFPGPLIEANWGDWIEVKVTNAISDEGTSIHWHGIRQNGTPWYDGVPSVSQCPIAPGQSFTYRFRADLYGSSWYHCKSSL
jgi:Multicopper oxidase